MKPLKERSAEDGALHHKELPVRVYEGCDAHQGRVDDARALIRKYLPRDILELGCGTGDISGPFAEEIPVIGYDVNELAIEKAKERFPRGCWMTSQLRDIQPTKGSLLVMCEFLEHLPNPFEVVKQWAPNFDYLLISHPLDEPMGCQLSAGDHQYSFSREDFAGWFEGFEILEEKTGTMGSYTYIVGIGKK